jgi:hypothetical protein
MIKTLRVEIHCIAEGEEKVITRIVDVDANPKPTIQEIKTELDLLLAKFGDITIPGTSA